MCSVTHSMISKAVAPSALACVGVMGVASPFLPAACNSGSWSIAPTLSSAIVSTDLVNNPAKAKFVRNMFQSLFRMGVLDRSSTLMCTFVEFEGAIASVLGTVDDARSAAKELLSQPSKSSQLRLWLSYAALESAVGNGGEGKRVLEKAVGLASQLTPEQSKHKYYLWATLALLACPPGSAATSHEALHCLISSVETGQPFTTFAKAMKKLDEPQKLVTAPRLLKARTSFQQVTSHRLQPLHLYVDPQCGCLQMWRSECEGMVASIRGLISSWLRSCSSASSQSPELVFPSGTPSTGLFCLTDLSISGESHLFPLAAFVLCSSLFELHTQGVSGVCAVCSRGVRTFRGLAAAFGRAKSCVSRGDSVAEAQSSVDATLSHWLNESNNEWCASLASIGRTSILLEQQGSIVTFDDSRLLEVFPVDSTDSVGAAIDALLVNCEWLYVWWAQLLHSHANTSAHSPRILRHMLEEALSSFPANPTLLSLYTAPERNVLHASVRIRQFLEKFLDLPDCPAVLWYHVISSELTRATHTTGDASESAEAPSVEIVSVQRLHRLFEQALATPTGQKSVLLWRLYLRFELVSGNAIGAKKVLLRALNHCPWSKSLWCDTVRRMRPYLTQQEQTDLLRVMAEKGLRLRTPLRTTKAEA